jgi:hypothetical protein
LPHTTGEHTLSNCRWLSWNLLARQQPGSSSQQGLSCCHRSPGVCVLVLTA